MRSSEHTLVRFKRNYEGNKKEIGNINLYYGF